MNRARKRGFPSSATMSMSAGSAASATQNQRHPTQKTSGPVAARQAAVLLATNTDDLERAYDDWAERYDEDLRSLGGGTNVAGSSTASVLLRFYFLSLHLHFPPHSRRSHQLR